MKFIVTEKDIIHGDTCSAQRCPIARAIRRRLPDQEIQVARYEIKIGLEIFEAAREIVAFTSSFDSGKPVKPFSFELELAKTKK
jgi:hypothetical protein